jgi:hypothetical protein
VRPRILVFRATPTPRRHDKPLVRLVLAITTLSAIGILAGCGEDPCEPTDPKCQGSLPDPYPLRNSPVAAVDYLKLAWANRDSTHADSVLASDYQGTSTDNGETVITTISFVKSDEMRALHGLKDDPAITSLSMDFGPQLSWRLDQYPNDPADWVVVIIDNPYIQLRTVNGLNDFDVSPSRTSFEFKTKPVVEGSRTLWQVVRWEEIHDSK